MIVNITADSHLVCPAGVKTKAAQGGFFAGLIVWNAGTVQFTDAAGNDSGVSDILPAGTVIAEKVAFVAAASTATVLGFYSPA